MPVNFDDLEPVPVFTDVDRARFESDIQPLHRPAVLKGVARDWPIVTKAQESDRALTDYIEAFDPGRAATALRRMASPSGPISQCQVFSPP